ncbi:hypothetical protein HMPREF1550_02083 [Actinomyces sp. oral taxon 877 str. F0543]|nr:hypothetical protein HMPREF1550_02083 [Actinomyces sp. oral taxon 877 str. F0543]
MRQDVVDLSGLPFEGGQGAPSTIRCIETRLPQSTVDRQCRVREHPAPSGALRQ